VHNRQRARSQQKSYDMDRHCGEPHGLTTADMPASHRVHLIFEPGSTAGTLFLPAASDLLCLAVTKRDLPESIPAFSVIASPTLVLDTPADFQLLAFPVGLKIRFACSLNLQQHGGVRVEQSKHRRARQNLHRSIAVYLGAAGHTGQHDFDGEAHGTNLQIGSIGRM